MADFVSSSVQRRSVLIGFAALALAGCSNASDLGLKPGDSFSRGYVPPSNVEQQVKVGQTQEQVLLSLGTPTTIATINGDVFYYISGKQERTFTFQKPKTVDQRVMAVYFNKAKKVERVADYGMQDGRVFDFVSRTTTSGGEEANFLAQIFKGPAT